ncbi:unnamed protein product [Schistosoma margrebowiei]|uniref:Uncharacterized protein n=1 Tax=Schistosoma margrebowiei TaxID=48269 RepID=A0A183LML9_9TREM|nr:unnamed protein product [Schistosoma margrebowiei]
MVVGGSQQETLDPGFSANKHYVIVDVPSNKQLFIVDKQWIVGRELCLFPTELVDIHLQNCDLPNDNWSTIAKFRMLVKDRLEVRASSVLSMNQTHPEIGKCSALQFCKQTVQCFCPLTFVSQSRLSHQDVIVNLLLSDFRMSRTTKRSGLSCANSSSGKRTFYPTWRPFFRWPPVDKHGFSFTTV